MIYRRQLDIRLAIGCDCETCKGRETDVINRLKAHLTKNAGSADIYLLIADESSGSWVKLRAVDEVGIIFSPNDSADPLTALPWRSVEFIRFQD